MRIDAEQGVRFSNLRFFLIISMVPSQVPAVFVEVDVDLFGLGGPQRVHQQARLHEHRHVNT